MHKSEVAAPARSVSGERSDVGRSDVGGGQLGTGKNTGKSPRQPCVAATYLPEVITCAHMWSAGETRGDIFFFALLLQIRILPDLNIDYLPSFTARLLDVSVFPVISVDVWSPELFCSGTWCKQSCFSKGVD